MTAAQDAAFDLAVIAAALARLGVHPWSLQWQNTAEPPQYKVQMHTRADVEEFATALADVHWEDYLDSANPGRVSCPISTAYGSLGKLQVAVFGPLSDPDPMVPVLIDEGVPF